MSYTITIPRVPPSLNKTLRMHWRKRTEMKHLWVNEIFCGCRETTVRTAKPVRIAKMEKKKVSITLHHARLFDKDNAYGACKVIFDALKALGLIWDDSPAYLDAEVRQQKSTRRAAHTVIEIGEAEGLSGGRDVE